MLQKDQKLSFKLSGKQVKTLCKCYGTKQKSATHIPTSYFQIPSGSIGEIRVSSTDTEYNITNILVKFNIEGQHFYSKLSEYMIEFID